MIMIQQFQHLIDCKNAYIKASLNYHGTSDIITADLNNYTTSIYEGVTFCIKEKEVHYKIKRIDVYFGFNDCYDEFLELKEEHFSFRLDLEVIENQECDFYKINKEYHYLKVLARLYEYH